MSDPAKTYVNSSVQVTPREGTNELRYSLTSRERSTAVHNLVSEGRKLGMLHRGVFSRARPTVYSVTIPGLKYDQPTEFTQHIENRASLTPQVSKAVASSQSNKRRRRIVNPEPMWKTPTRPELTQKPPKLPVFYSVEDFEGKKSPVKSSPQPIMQRRKTLYEDSAKKYHALKRKLTKRRMSEQTDNVNGGQVITLQKKLEMGLPMKYRTPDSQQLWTFNPAGYENLALNHCQ